MSSRKTRSHSLTSLPLLFLSAAVLASSAGCVSASHNAAAVSSVKVPSTWQQAPSTDNAALDTTAIREWWRRFNDPVLDTLIADALASSSDIRTAISRIAESRARLGVERASLAPSVHASASGSGSRRKNNDTGATTRSESYSASLDASWEIDLFGQQRASTSAAAADVAQTVENYRAVQVSLAAEVASTYVTLRSAEAQLTVVQQSLDSRAETIQLLNWQEQAGMSDTLATQQAVSTYEQARASLPSLRQTVEQTRNALALLAGKTPGALDTLLGHTATVPASPAALAAGIPAETLSQRPDVRAAANAFDAAALRTSAAQRARLPSLTLAGSIGVEALKAGKLFDPPSTLASIAGSLTAPIFDAGRLRQNARIQDEFQRQALITYESTVLTALSEVENALVAVQRTAERLTILDRAVAAAREASSLADIQYQAGSGDILTVLDAQRTLLSVEQQQVITRADQATAHIHLYKALGGGWSATSASSIASADTLSR